MTIILDASDGVEVKTWPSPFGSGVCLNTKKGLVKVDMRDFCVMARYVLTNTDLVPDDPRLELVREVKAMRRIDGFNSGARRLSIAPRSKGRK